MSSEPSDNQPQAPLHPPSHHHSSSRRSSIQPFPPLSPATSATEAGTSLPMRHPRPLTAAELHLAVEKEQEAIVNRLTRELTALRAHSASVASTASTASNAPPFYLDLLDPTSMTHPLPLANGPTHPTSTRPNRSGSNASATHHPSSLPVTVIPGAIPMRTTRSSSNSIQGTPRYDDVAQHRLELEEAKRENERLRQRVIELEATLRERRTGSTSAASTTTTNGYHGSGNEDSPDLEDNSTPSA